MYSPKRYKKEDKEYIFKFIQQHPFATMVLNGKRLLATHIPVLARGNANDFILHAHIANHNAMQEFLQDEIEVLLIFHGTDGYVSSSWYTEKKISTWDYSAVHVNARLKLQSKGELITSLKDLVFKFEKNQRDPLYYKDIPAEMLEENLKEITGFFAKPFKVEAIAKYHQDFEAEDIHKITKHLKDSENPKDHKLGKAIQKNNEENN
jgi:transcriptional regulator